MNSRTLFTFILIQQEENELVKSKEVEKTGFSFSFCQKCDDHENHILELSMKLEAELGRRKKLERELKEAQQSFYKVNAVSMEIYSCIDDFLQSY